MARSPGWGRPAPHSRLSEAHWRPELQYLGAPDGHQMGPNRRGGREGKARLATETRVRTMFLVGAGSPDCFQCPHLRSCARREGVRSPRLPSRHPDIGKWRHRHTVARPCHTCGKSHVGLHRHRTVCHKAFIRLWKHKRQVQGWAVAAGSGSTERSCVPAVEKLPSSS